MSALTALLAAVLLAICPPAHHPACHHHAGRHHPVCVQPGGPIIPAP